MENIRDRKWVYLVELRFNMGKERRRNNRNFAIKKRKLSNMIVKSVVIIDRLVGNFIFCKQQLNLEAWLKKLKSYANKEAESNNLKKHYIFEDEIKITFCNPD